MKISRITLTFSVFILSFLSLSAQDKVQNWDGKIVLNGEYLKKEILIEVANESQEISVSVDGKVAGGNLKVKLYNPRGIRMANINLNAGKGGTAKGTMEEAMDASPGIWKLKVLSEDARGKVNIKVQQN